MSRQVLTFLIALAIAVSGYQPSFGMKQAMPAEAEATMSMSADGDCAEKMAHDCCDMADTTDKSTQFCQWHDACAVRCHVNAGLEAFTLEFAPETFRYVLVPTAQPPPLHPARAGPLFRPPIV